MYWPGTTAAAPGTAGLDGESAPPVRTPVTGPVAGPIREKGPAAGSPGTAAQAAGSGSATVSLPLLKRARHLPCMDDPDLFFAESPEDVETAKALCRDCPVRLRCLAGALERREPWGVWGGELFLRGEVVPRKRPRGRPRKSEVAA